jgi:hypothetical protein
LIAASADCILISEKTYKRFENCIIGNAKNNKIVFI